MKLVVGLGNPGKEYVNTRHNIGFMYLDYIVSVDNFKLNKKFNAMEYETNIGGEVVLFIKPLSYMNLSGEVVYKYVNYYKMGLNDIVIIQDDLDMSLGKCKLLFNRSAGGHNGIKNIILNLSTCEFLRVKIGISKVSNINTKDYVLGKFSKEDMSILENTFKYLDNFIFDFVKLNRDLLMCKYNSKIQEG